jgi:hypothetical protein
MLISAFNAYQWDDMAAFNAYQCEKNEIDLSRNDHFFCDGLSDSSFLFPPNPTV